ncbi:FAD-binding domain-containing protein [Paracoccus sp. 1_MG-2023]|uniref:FAD-binding domain-containing protein n=1 Tax=unclassified Paracoccus (in: a-proteobacteria) TaxID=2688777 RepID=UPI001C09AE49|nr:MULTISPECIES: FAD-binding domain-containing protein [unclassified Paracoccus (in: a-proteobacteria)]MBU2958121.1 deoxyribodipyrimidine photolyase [Paracoccus sp. C2R09]MDO6669293.1 FAD-binding domain-containing protein [Paracoccus sp. 1_MG-2023]
MAWPGTRIDAEKRLADFAPFMGDAYCRRRGFDRGPGRHSDVSRLSPLLRHRLILERDCIELAIRTHGRAADRFVHEVFWRSYFKGWLEQHPQVWTDSRPDGPPDEATLRAMRGETGIDCFDAWVRELVGTGYLHNHARMWFASIWIFTLGLSWRRGADFFLRHLLDGDPASNTLSWRWVAGLHSRGKSYLADPRNIAEFTLGRFNPTGLATTAPPLDHQEPDAPERRPLHEPQAPQPGRPTVLLITPEDCRPEDFAWPETPRAAATLHTSHLRSDLPVAPMVAEYEDALLRDAGRRSGYEVTRLRAGDPRQLADWAQGHRATQIVTPHVPTGPLRDWLDAARPHLDARGITLAQQRRDWDRIVHPFASAGYFKLKKRIPEILQATGLA